MEGNFRPAKCCAHNIANLCTSAQTQEPSVPHDDLMTKLSRDVDFDGRLHDQRHREQTECSRAKSSTRATDDNRTEARSSLSPLRDRMHRAKTATRLLASSHHEIHNARPAAQQRFLVVAKPTMRVARAIGQRGRRRPTKRCIMVNASLRSVRANIIEQSLTEHLALCRACCAAFSLLVSARSPVRR